MTFNRYARRIDANQDQIVSALESAGFRVKVIGHPVDLLIASAGKFALVEVKDGDKVKSAQKKTAAQDQFFKDYSDCPLFLVNTPESAVEMLNAWRLA